MNVVLAGDRADGAAYHHEGDVDTAQLQPFGSANLVRILPRAGKKARRAVPDQRLSHNDTLSEIVEGQNTHEGGARDQDDDDIGFVAFGCTLDADTRSMDCCWEGRRLHRGTTYVRFGDISMKLTRKDPRLLRGLHYFEAVARLGSVGAAAKEFGVSSSAVSHQLRELAGIVGEKLVEKSGRGIALTPAGDTLSRKLQSTFNELDRMVAEVVGQTQVTFSLAVCSCFGPSWLAPRLPDFFARHPGIDLEVRLYHQDPEQTHTSADAIVTADPVKPGYDSIPLFDELLVAVRRPGAQALDSNQPHRLITTDLEPASIGRDWLDFCAQKRPRPRKSENWGMDKKHPLHSCPRNGEGRTGTGTCAGFPCGPTHRQG